MAGRPNLISKYRIGKICHHVSQGMSIADTAILCDLSPSTLENWLRIGRRLKSGDGKSLGKFDELYILLVEKVEHARSSLKEKLFEVPLREALEFKDAKMALELLARKWPAEFGRKDSSQNIVLVNLSTAGIVNGGQLDGNRLDAFIDELDKGSVAKGSERELEDRRPPSREAEHSISRVEGE